MSEEELQHDRLKYENFDWANHPWNEDDMEWSVNLRMNIKEVRLLYSIVSHFIDHSSGLPGRPPDEEHYLKFLKGELYKMIQDYNFTHNNS